MKRLAFGLVAVALLVLGSAQLSRADLIINYSVNGTPQAPVTCTGNAFTCMATVNFGGITGSITAGSNLPGFPSGALNQQTNNDLAAGASGGTVNVTVIATGFTMPLGNQTLSVTGTNNTGLGTFSYTAGGGGNATNGTTITTGPLSCGPMTTLTTCSGGSIAFSPSGTFSLISTGSVTLGGSSSINATTTVLTNAVPEPASILLFGSGLLGLAGLVRRKIKA